MKSSFEELRQAAGVWPPKKKNKRAKEKTGPKAVPLETVGMSIPFPLSVPSAEKREPKPAPLTKQEKVHTQSIVA